MTNTLVVIFIISAVLIIYSYAIYPAVIYVLSIIFEKKIQLGDKKLRFTIIISAYNEEKVINKKLSNALALEYDRDKFDIIVVSDCSDDSTDEIVKSFDKENVRLIRANERKGKTAGLNVAVPESSGEIVLFTDADAMLEKDVLAKIASIMNDNTIGVVTGSTKYSILKDGKSVDETSGLYTRIEKFIKKYESKIGSCVGADGAIFALRKELYQTLRDDDINDLVIPLNVITQGYRVVLGDNVYCQEEPSESIENEFKRQVRITTRTLWAIVRNCHLLNILKYPAFSFMMVSHKIIRFMIPFFMVVAYITNILLIGQFYIFDIVYLLQNVFYLTGLVGYLLAKKGKDSGVFCFVYHFILIQLSVLLGWVNLLKGKSQVIWSPRK